MFLCELDINIALGNHALCTQPVDYLLICYGFAVKHIYNKILDHDWFSGRLFVFFLLKRTSQKTFFSPKFVIDTIN